MKVFVPEADRQERLRRHRADALLHVVAELVASLLRRHGHGDDEQLGIAGALRKRGCAHRRANREAVVDDDGCVAFDLDGVAVAAIRALAPGQLLLLGGGGAPSLRTTRTSSNRPRARASSNPTGTPPHGSASTTTFALPR